MYDKKRINGYDIYKEGTWCEITKDEHHIFKGNVDEKMTLEQIYKVVMTEVVFSIKGKEVLAYDLLNEFRNERKETIKLLAEENECNEEDIKVTIRKPKLNKRTREAR